MTVKVLHVCWADRAGGLEQVVRTLSGDMNAPVYYLFSEPSGLRQSVLQRWRLVGREIRRRQATVVHVHDSVLPFLAGLLNRQVRLVIYTRHTARISPTLPIVTFLSRVFRQKTHLVGVSQVVVHQMKRCAGPGARITVVYNGVPVTVRPGPNDGHQRFRVIYVGRITRAKGVYVFLMACKLFSTFANRSVEGIIVGDGPERARVEEAIRHQGLSGVVLALGPRTHEDVLRHIASSDILVNPSMEREGFGMTIIEALSLGKPVIASDQPAFREILEQAGRYLGCWFTKPGDSLAIALRLRDIYKAWPESEINLSSRRQEYVQRNFSAIAMCRAYKEIYDSVRSPL